MGDLTLDASLEGPPPGRCCYVSPRNLLTKKSEEENPAMQEADINRLLQNALDQANAQHDGSQILQGPTVPLLLPPNHSSLEDIFLSCKARGASIVSPCAYDAPGIPLGQNPRF